MKSRGIYDIAYSVVVLVCGLVALRYVLPFLAQQGLGYADQNVAAIIIFGLMAWAFYARWQLRRRKVKQAAERFAKVAAICQGCERGVFKRIDENRELFEFLRRECPELVNRAPWIVGWLESQDHFLVELAEAVGTTNHLASSRFPRPWQGQQRKGA